jgi:hypothetical protein
MGGVLVHDMTDLVTPVASVQLPYPDFSDHRAYYGGTSGGVRPATTVTAPSTGTSVAPTPMTDPATPPPAQ